VKRESEEERRKRVERKHNLYPFAFDCEKLRQQRSEGPRGRMRGRKGGSDLRRARRARKKERNVELKLRNIAEYVEEECRSIGRVGRATESEGGRLRRKKRKVEYIKAYRSHGSTTH